jgi:hypothetical protein
MSVKKRPLLIKFTLLQELKREAKGKETRSGLGPRDISP